MTRCRLRVRELGSGVDSFVVGVDSHPGRGGWGGEACVWVGCPLDWCACVVAGFLLHYFARELLFFFVVGVEGAVS